MATLSTQLPSRSLRRQLANLLSLAKPRLSFLIVLTTATAYSLYPVPGLEELERLAPTAATTAASAPSAVLASPALSTLTLLFLTTGTALCSSAANTLNMLLEPAHDAKMSRTRNRPLVRKLVSRRGAVVFAAVCGVAGIAALYYGVNPTTAFLGALNIGLYAAIYTPLKRVSVANTWVGALVGGIPPLMGWTAAAGSSSSSPSTPPWHDLLAGPSATGGWLLAALLFAWQFPHFNALSYTIRDEYRAAGYRMLCWVSPARNARVAVRYALLMFPLCIGLSLVGVTDRAFIATSSAANAWLALRAVQFWKAQGQRGSARALFWASVWHLPIVLVLAMAHKRGLWDRVGTALGIPYHRIDQASVADEHVDENGDCEKFSAASHCRDEFGAAGQAKEPAGRNWFER